MTTVYVPVVVDRVVKMVRADVPVGLLGDRQHDSLWKIILI